MSIPVRAQSGKGDWGSVKNLGKGTEVEISTAGSKVKGRIESVTDTAIELEFKGHIVTIVGANVERVYSLGSKDRKKGAVVGAVVGGGAGVGVGTGIYAQGDFVGSVVPIFGLIGAGIGAGIGAVFGRRKKRLVYQA